jgi:hypothetical protein
VRYQLTTIAALTSAGGPGAAQPSIAQADRIWNPVIGGAMILEGRENPTVYKPIVDGINCAAPTGLQLKQEVIDQAFAGDKHKVEAWVTAMIREGYGMKTPESTKGTMDGLSGESILDWINRPLP